MKINNESGIPVPRATAGDADRIRRAAKARKAYASSEAAESHRVSADRAEISDKARAMQVAAAALKQTPQVRANKVGALKAKIQNGTYQVSGEDIAERLLKDDTLV